MFLVFVTIFLVFKSSFVDQLGQADGCLCVCITASDAIRTFIQTKPLLHRSQKERSHPRTATRLTQKPHAQVSSPLCDAIGADAMTQLLLFLLHAERRGDNYRNHSSHEEISLVMHCTYRQHGFHAKAAFSSSQFAAPDTKPRILWVKNQTLTARDSGTV